MPSAAVTGDPSHGSSSYSNQSSLQRISHGAAGEKHGTEVAYMAPAYTVDHDFESPAAASELAETL
jgi:hypothetical protein